MVFFACPLNPHKKFSPIVQEKFYLVKEDTRQCEAKMVNHKSIRLSLQLRDFAATFFSGDFISFLSLTPWSNVSIATVPATPLAESPASGKGFLRVCSKGHQFHSSTCSSNP